LTKLDTAVIVVPLRNHRRRKQQVETGGAPPNARENSEPASPQGPFRKSRGGGSKVMEAPGAAAGAFDFLDPGTISSCAARSPMPTGMWFDASAARLDIEKEVNDGHQRLVQTAPRPG
jgi:hypothetical protein